MKAFSPVRSIRKNSLSDHSLGISRSKTPVDDPMSLLCNMKDCYSKLKELVPASPKQEEEGLDLKKGPKTFSGKEQVKAIG
ncbi:hypothetical protein MJG53_002087 [Ovis ammon polii x Ovis aries]|uniref:Uncharacterized protein n=1 Tax=Ovis ammon polii x Ovis aries TaxID=2918886 RepID=A0ACB9VN40_9CETA|nr:hypothetical protein MJG53_002087 [Ovis ammon polii x Ovis aries]